MILKYICRIIQTYMDLGDGVVYLRNEKINQTKKNDFNIVVGYLSQKNFGTSTSIYNGVETVSVNVLAQVYIEIYGRSFDVVERKEEILMALSSSFSKEVQTSEGFLIAQVPSSFVEVPLLDGSAIPYRFQATFNVQFMKKIEKPIDYYDSIRSEVKYES